MRHTWIRNLLAAALLVLLLPTLILPILADEVPDYINDRADLLTQEQVRTLRQELETISNAHEMSVAVYTVDSIGYRTPEQAAAAYCSTAYLPYEAGIVLLIAMDDHDFCFYSFGGAEEIFNDDALDALEDGVVPHLSNKHFADAFLAYADLCDEIFCVAADKGEYTAPFDWQSTLLIALIVGFVVAIITVSVMRSKLKTVRARAGAAEYTRRDSMRITASHDLYLYRHVSRRLKPKSNSSSGGRSSGGGSRSGKF